MVATKLLIQPSIPIPIPIPSSSSSAAAAAATPHVFPSKSTTIKIQKLFHAIRCSSSPHSSSLASSSGAKAAERVVSDEVIATAEETSEEDSTVAQIKEDLYAQLQGINRGIFGTPSAKKAEIEKLVELLEAQNPTPHPTLCLEKVEGAWKLAYSTITILGAKRTKLGLRDFIALGDFIQSINVAEGKAINIIKFSSKGLNLLNGQLSIEASFKIASKSRVDISYCKSEIIPEQLMNVFRKNYELLLGVFNPEGWLEITYVDDNLRIGRDGKGNFFILERVAESD